MCWVHEICVHHDAGSVWTLALTLTHACGLWRPVALQRDGRHGYPCGVSFRHAAAVQPGPSPWVVFLAPVAVVLSCAYGHQAQHVSSRDGSRLALVQFSKAFLIASLDGVIAMLRVVPVVCN